VGNSDFIDMGAIEFWGVGILLGCGVGSVDTETFWDGSIEYRIVVAIREGNALVVIDKGLELGRTDCWWLVGVLDVGNEGNKLGSMESIFGFMESCLVDEIEGFSLVSAIGIALGGKLLGLTEYSTSLGALEDRLLGTMDGMTKGSSPDTRIGLVLGLFDWLKIGINVGGGTGTAGGNEEGVVIANGLVGVDVDRIRRQQRSPSQSEDVIGVPSQHPQ
jgi:hypothetical protein